MKINETPKITVAVRKRPLNKKEILRGQTDIIRVGPFGQVTVSENKQKVDLTKYCEQTTFNFNYAFDQNSTNEEIYDHAVRPLIENAFKGAKISCFAYGQTGSGKTYTMKGDMSREIPGIYFLGAKQIFRLLQLPQHRHMLAYVSFFEIYCSKIYDLLNNRVQLKIREDNKGNLNIVGIQPRLIASAKQFMDVIEYGSQFRVTSQNNTNADSSRSHAILEINLKDGKKVYSKISFIDLAGNQRGADHMDQNKQTKIDGAQINKSLLTLKQCIRALDNGKSHTPFRGSKLTMVLKQSFVGYCNTVMICNVSPNVSSSQNTMNTLRYADLVNDLKKQPGQARQNLTKQQILARQLMLPRANNKNCVKVNIDRYDDQEDIKLKLQQARKNQQINKYQQKMDIQQPKNHNIYSNNYLKKAQIHQPRFNNEKRQTHNVNPIPKGRVQGSNNVRGSFQIQKQPLNSRNVHLKQLDQNNMNNVNTGLLDQKKIRPVNSSSQLPSYVQNNNNFQNPFQNNPQNNNYSQNFNYLQNNYQQYNNNYPPQNMNNTINVQRNQFQAMSNLRNNFQNYREQHQELIKQEMQIFRMQINYEQDFKQKRRSFHEGQCEQINQYLNTMENFINQKINIMHIMKSNIQKMRNQAKNAQVLTNKLKQQNNQSYNFIGRNQMMHTHSQPNGLNLNNFNGFNNFGDEQLLEGLPDDSISRLF